jgi:Family of unknown function (DUF5662)
VTDLDTTRPTGYDSRADTLLHAARVAQITHQLTTAMMDRAIIHDRSKTQDPEVAAFDRASQRLRTLPYPSPEYDASLAELKPALDHHYAVNRHHPQHFPDGVTEMTLVDLVEMFADWKASTERTAGGDLHRSIIHNMARFGISRQLAQILLNTAIFYGWAEPDATLPDTP